jgi:hypothetical protein
MSDEYALLGVGEAASWLTAVTVSCWGNTVVIACETGTGQLYRLIYRDCRHLEWEVYGPEDATATVANLIGIKLGQKAHVEPAVITTDIFELAILYESFELQKEK